MAVKTLETLRDLHCADRQIRRALPGMARGARSEELKAAVERHRDETEGHVERPRQVFEPIGRRARGRSCPSVDGVLEDGEEARDGDKRSDAFDAGPIAARAEGRLRDGPLRRAAAMGRDIGPEGRGQAARPEAGEEAGRSRRLRGACESGLGPAARAMGMYPDVPIPQDPPLPQEPPPAPDLPPFPDPHPDPELPEPGDPILPENPQPDPPPIYS